MFKCYDRLNCYLYASTSALKWRISTNSHLSYWTSPCRSLVLWYTKNDISNITNQRCSASYMQSRSRSEIEFGPSILAYSLLSSNDLVSWLNWDISIRLRNSVGYNCFRTTDSDSGKWFLQPHKLWHCLQTRDAHETAFYSIEWWTTITISFNLTTHWLWLLNNFLQILLHH